MDVPSERYEPLEDRLQATSDFAAVGELDALTICVPTPLSKTHPRRFHRRGGRVRRGQPSARPAGRSTVDHPSWDDRGDREADPGAWRRRDRRDVFLGYAPERIVDPGNKSWTIKTTPKLVAGVTDECRRRTELLYRQIVDTVIPVSSPMVAETAKLHENTFRAGQHRARERAGAHVRQARDLCVGGDRGGLLEAVRVPAALPGPGLGGDCIPVVPHFLAAQLREYGYSPQLIEAAHEINTRMPAYVVQKVADALNEQSRPIKGSRILLLGMAYKADVHDTRESPSFEVIASSSPAAATSSTCDPWVPDVELDGALCRASTGRWRSSSARRLRGHAHAAQAVQRAAALGARAPRSRRAERRSRPARASTASSIRAS